MRRNRSGVLAAAAFLVLLAGGGITSTTLYLRAEEQRVLAEREQSRARQEADWAEREAERARLAEAEQSRARQEAEEERDKFEAINEFVTKALASSDPNQQGTQAFKVTDAMDQAIALLDAGELNHQPETEAALGLTIARILNGNARSADALGLAERALEINQQLHPGDHPYVAACLNGVAVCLDSLGRSAEALPKFEAALEMYQRLFEGEHPLVAESLDNVAYCLQSLGRSAEALRMYEAALEMHRRVLPSGHPHTLYPQIGLAITLTSLERYAEAEPLLLDAAGQCEQSDASRRMHWQSVVKALVALYDACHAAEPDKGYDQKAAEWRGKLEEWQAATQPNKPQPTVPQPRAVVPQDGPRPRLPTHVGMPHEAATQPGATHSAESRSPDRG